ncbi:MAG TPA: TldD/PmbA family protein [Planctomycetota bacterium]|nr:TldD/PmbA family protein [Planctomycetota bacterium]
MNANDVVERALAAVRADDARASLTSTRRGWVRFGADEIRAIGETEERALTIEASIGRRRGSAQGNDLRDDAVRALAERAVAAARLAPEDPEHVETLGPQERLDTRPLDPSTDHLDPAERARVARGAIDAARREGLHAAGYVETLATEYVLATAHGLRADEKRTAATYTVTMRTPDGTGSGWGASQAVAFDELATAQTTDRAVRHAIASHAPEAIEPGTYPVVLEPDALADLVHNLVFAMGAREAEEGRSFASKPGGGTRAGERLFSPLVTIATDPVAMREPSFDGDGLPIRPSTWVRDGAIDHLWVTRSWARKTGVEPVPRPTAIRMRGGAATLDELLAPIERGLYVPRIHYIRPVDPRNVLLTGMTRDGVRLIEKGKLGPAVKNLRWTQSVVDLLAAIEAVGATRRLVTYEFEDSPIEIPAVRASAFRFTGVSDSV